MTQSEQILTDTAIRCGIREAMPDRDAILAAIRDGAERALRPAAHPLIGRRVRKLTPAVVAAATGWEGHVESVQMARYCQIAVVRCGDGTAYTAATHELAVLPETP